MDIILVVILMVILLSYLFSDIQRASTYCYRNTTILSFRGLVPEADLGGGRGGRTPPLSEFQPLVMGLFATVHAPSNPPPQDLSLLG